jgi:hypothetical protein
MAAGLAMLDLIQTPQFYDELDRRTRLLTDTFQAAADEAGVPLTINRVCGMFGLFFTREKVETYAQATACDVAMFKRFSTPCSIAASISRRARSRPVSSRSRTPSRSSPTRSTRRVRRSRPRGSPSGSQLGASSIALCT